MRLLAVVRERVVPPSRTVGSPSELVHRGNTAAKTQAVALLDEIREQFKFPGGTSEPRRRYPP